MIKRGNQNTAFAVIACGCLAAGCVLGLGGCQAVEETMQTLIPEEKPPYEVTTLQVNGDGTLMEEIIDTLDESYYSGEELHALVEDTVSTFNAENGADSVTVEDFTQEGSAIDLRMTYADAAAYASYNHVPAFNGSMLEAQMEGYLFLQDFRKVEEGVSAPQTIANDEPLSHKEYQVLVTDASHAVDMPARVRYVSANAAVSDWTRVTPASAETTESEQGLVLPSSAVYVESGQGGEVSDEERESGYVYIIYE